MWILAVIVCVAVFLWLCWQRVVAAIIDEAGAAEGEGITKHRQIQELEAVGIRFRSEEEKHRFLLNCGPEASDHYYHHPYDALLADAGYEGLLNRVWSPLDRECVGEEDTYAGHLEGLRSISGLPIENIRGYDTYWVAFTLLGKDYTWKGKENNDWMDVGLAGYLNWALGRSKDAGIAERFYLDDSHIAPLYLFGGPELAAELNKLPRLRFQLAKK